MSHIDRHLHKQMHFQMLSKVKFPQEKRGSSTLLPLAKSNSLDALHKIETADDNVLRTVDAEGLETRASIPEPISEVGFQVLYPFLDWWWPDPPTGYVDANAHLLWSRLPVLGPVGEMTIFEPSDKELYSVYRNVLLTCPKLIDDVDSPNLPLDWVATYSKALTQSERPSHPSEEKPGFKKMETNTGTIACENFVVADGRNWISGLKKMAKENESTPVEDHGLIGILPNLSFDCFTDSVPAMSLNVPMSIDSFISVLNSSNNWESFDVALNDKKASVSVKVGAVARVPVHPDPHWYDGDYLHTLAKHDYWNSPFTTTAIFGQNGLLYQRINGLVAAYHIRFKITVSPKTFKAFEPQFKSAFGFRVGPFKFGDAEAKASTGWNQEADPNTSTFEGESMADHPTIIGVTIEKVLPVSVQ